MVRKTALMVCSKSCDTGPADSGSFILIEDIDAAENCAGRDQNDIAGQIALLRVAIDHFGRRDPQLSW